MGKRRMAGGQEREFRFQLTEKWIIDFSKAQARLRGRQWQATTDGSIRGAQEWRSGGAVGNSTCSATRIARHRRGPGRILRHVSYYLLPLKALWGLGSLVFHIKLEYLNWNRSKVSKEDIYVVELAAILLGSASSPKSSGHSCLWTRTWRRPYLLQPTQLHRWTSRDSIAASG